MEEKLEQGASLSTDSTSLSKLQSNDKRKLNLTLSASLSSFPSKTTWQVVAASSPCCLGRSSPQQKSGGVPVKFSA